MVNVTMRTLLVVSGLLVIAAAQTSNDNNSQESTTSVNSADGEGAPDNRPDCKCSRPVSVPISPAFPPAPPYPLRPGPNYPIPNTQFPFMGYPNTQPPYGQNQPFPYWMPFARNRQAAPALRTTAQPYSYQWMPMQREQNPSETSPQGVPVQSYSPQQYGRGQYQQQPPREQAQNSPQYGQYYQQYVPDMHRYGYYDSPPAVMQAPVQQVYYQAPNSDGYPYESSYVQQMPVQQVLVMN